MLGVNDGLGGCAAPVPVIDADVYLIFVGVAVAVTHFREAKRGFDFERIWMDFLVQGCVILDPGSSCFFLSLEIGRREQGCPGTDLSNTPHCLWACLLASGRSR